MKLILASGSPRRKKIFEQLGLTFTVSPPGIDEEFNSNENPAVEIEKIAVMKAESVVRNHPDSLIIAADTVVLLDGEVVGKPADSAEAANILKWMSGKTHTVITGVSLIQTLPNGSVTKRISFHEETKVTFASLSDKEIESYVAGGSPLDKAGAYGIQDDWGAIFVSKIEGDFYNVVGFPVHKFYTILKQTAPEFLNHIIYKNETFS